MNFSSLIFAMSREDVLKKEAMDTFAFHLNIVTYYLQK